MTEVGPQCGNEDYLGGSSIAATAVMIRQAAAGEVVPSQPPPSVAPPAPLPAPPPVVAAPWQAPAWTFTEPHNYLGCSGTSSSCGCIRLVSGTINAQAGESSPDGSLAYPSVSVAIGPGKHSATLRPGSYKFQANITVQVQFGEPSSGPVVVARTWDPADYFYPPSSLGTFPAATSLGNGLYNFMIDTYVQYIDTPRSYIIFASE